MSSETYDLPEDERNPYSPDVLDETERRMRAVSRKAIALNEKRNALRDELQDCKQARDRVLASADAVYRPHITELEMNLAQVEDEFWEAEQEGFVSNA